ncbi:hypothetical protein H4219_003403, partial [Mycoemilia scoparia]
ALACGAVIAGGAATFGGEGVDLSMVGRLKESMLNKPRESGSFGMTMVAGVLLEQCDDDVFEAEKIDEADDDDGIS